MPTYGYECLSCDNQFETIQSIKDNALTTCDTCGGTLRKRIYPVGISFKGSGFYVNDYAPKPSDSTSGSSPDAPKAEPGGEAKADAPSSDTSKSEPAKTESKPEAKTETKSETKAELKTLAATAPS